MKYEVTTTPFTDGRIASMIEFVDEAVSMRLTIYRHVLDTQEAQIRQALIQLGWAPPPAC